VEPGFPDLEVVPDEQQTDAGDVGTPAAEVAVTESAEPAEHAEPAETGGEVAKDEAEPRRYPSTIGGACYLVVLAAMVVALVIVSVGEWRTGIHWLAGALLGAAVVRGVLRSRDAGMLAVRNRWFDVALLGATGVVLWILGTSVPNA